MEGNALINTTNLSVLLVDDEETFVNVLALELRENYGYKTTVAFSGREAIDLIKNSKSAFDVILLDYNMPDLNGLNVLQWMLEEKNETPVVMLTAAGSEQIAVEALKLGAYDYVRKELIDINHIDILLRGTCERHQFRVAEAMEKEKQGEMAMDNYATDLVRLVINAVTPKLNTSLAQITVCAETYPKDVLIRIHKNERRDLDEIFGEILEHVKILESSTTGLLNLIDLLYARRELLPEIEKIKHWLQKELKIKKFHNHSLSHSSELINAAQMTQKDSFVNNILIIDDDEMMLNALKTLLEDEHYRVTTTNDGHKGIELFREQRQDVVLLDLKLPSITGLEILQEIKSIEFDSKVIIVTGFSSPEAVEEAKSLGAFGFYEKSRDVEELLGLIRRAANESRSVATKSTS
jgi:DNA-binding NtrC family response regulator